MGDGDSSMVGDQQSGEAGDQQSGEGEMAPCSVSLSGVGEASRRVRKRYYPGVQTGA